MGKLRETENGDFWDEGRTPGLEFPPWPMHTFDVFPLESGVLPDRRNAPGPQEGEPS